MSTSIVIIKKKDIIKSVMDVEKLEPSFLVGMWNGSATVENTSAVLQKVKHRIAIWPSNFTPKYIVKRNENVCPNKNFVYECT